MTVCGVCYTQFDLEDYSSLANHFIQNANSSNMEHIKWLNAFISKKKLDQESLQNKLIKFYDIADIGLQNWIKKIFVKKFYSNNPHPFILALQHPSRSTLLGYVIEHQHFLRQWVRSCSFIMAKTDQMDVTLYELDNINTEFGGLPPDVPSHYEYLLRMGESLGISREQILSTDPLPDTKRAIDFWNSISEDRHWLEAMTAMHSLELIAYRNIKDYGASLTYFDPKILDGDGVTEDTKQFLREGYEADVTHADEALDLVAKYATSDTLIEKVQGTFLQSIDWFDKYLTARLVRSKDFYE
ncbi:MAG: thiaminase II/PqqC family protein [Candidatus Kariarchaeaceae archaeon]|jgi:pyrroloquinoline-quinone synthase